MNISKFHVNCCFVDATNVLCCVVLCCVAGMAGGGGALLTSQCYVT